MLSEIKCEAFQSYGKPREIIKFKQGLNTVLGGAAANNSIGKSTFLLIIDYCFGGETYGKSDVKNHVGDHTICFAFEFDGKKHYFSRTVSKPKVVDVCNSEYRPLKSMKLDDFRAFLYEHYCPDVEDAKFREIISRFFRIAGKKNDTVNNPLNDAAPQMEPAVVALEKLFGLYKYVGTLRNQLKESEEKKKAFAQARKFQLVPYSITRKKQYDQNVTRIAELEKQLSELTQDTDQDLLKEELKRKDSAAEVNSQLQGMKRQYKKLASQYRIVTKNMDENFVTTETDLQRLASYFPSVNIKKIEEVESFHRDLSGILEAQMSEEAAGLQALIRAATGEIQKLEAQLAELGIPLQVPKSFLEHYSDIERQIAGLRSQNEAYDNTKKFKVDVETTKKELTESERTVLDQLEAKINAQMVRYNDFIYEEEREAPIIKFENGKKYSFTTPRDGGTGTAYKSLVVLDMSILTLTDLPAIAHDSSIFKNIGDEPIDKIMEMYAKSKKQIFIAFDKEQAYTEKTGKILNQTAVLRLNEGGDELFGWSWAKKKKK